MFVNDVFVFVVVLISNYYYLLFFCCFVFLLTFDICPDFVPFNLNKKFIVKSILVLFFPFSKVLVYIFVLTLLLKKRKYLPKTEKYTLQFFLRLRLPFFQKSPTGSTYKCYDLHLESWRT